MPTTPSSVARTTLAGATWTTSAWACNTTSEPAQRSEPKPEPPAQVAPVFSFLFDFRLEALRMQPGIQAVGTQQLAVRALFHDLAVGQHHHAVGVFDGGQAVRDHQGGAALHEAGQRI